MHLATFSYFNMHLLTHVQAYTNFLARTHPHTHPKAGMCTRMHIRTHHTYTQTYAHTHFTFLGHTYFVP